MSFLNYTTQQLQGGGKYSVKTKIGNWYEDMVMDETKFKDYIRLKESNNLMVAKKVGKGISDLHIGDKLKVAGNAIAGAAKTSGHFIADTSKKAVNKTKEGVTNLAEKTKNAFRKGSGAQKLENKNMKNIKMKKKLL